MVTALIILVYNNANNVQRLIESIEQYNTAIIKLIIIDNGSPNLCVPRSICLYLMNRYNKDDFWLYDDADNEKEELPYCTFVKNSKNIGFSAGNNKGLSLAYADDSIKNVFILNDDIIWIDDIIPRLVEKLYSLPHAGMICPLSLKTDETIDLACVRKLRPMWEEFISMVHYTYRESELLIKKNPEIVNNEYIIIEPPIGCSILMKKDDIMKVGGYDENSFLYYEEYILQKKFSTIGAINYAIPSCRLIHIGSVSTKQVNNKFIGSARLNSAFYFYKTYFELGIFAKSALYFLYYLGKIRLSLNL